MMPYPEFRRLVADMMQAQGTYYRAGRDDPNKKTYLAASIKLEGRVRAELASDEQGGLFEGGE